MAGSVSALLPDGRLHLHEGPIDLVIGLEGTRPAVAEARARATAAFEGLLAGLVAELPLLRAPLGADPPAVRGPVARRMVAAVWPYRTGFITPMAAVAGAVAEEVLAAIAGVPGLGTAHVNNGGDIALHLAPGEALRIGLVRSLEAAVPEGLVRIAAADPVRGIATSGWQGRSFSRGIADAVTVLAATAAEADAAATVIANAVDAVHPAVRRVPASSLDPDSDLGELPVTIGVGPLPAAVVEDALDAGEAVAERLVQRGLVVAALLAVGDATRAVGPPRLTDTAP
ncbi:thiamine biosynthesis protein ApbE [Siccirubricoccus deserti]|uniref:UPF0280 family protein n=1 Tax=Siccirubricoccus deserti TaxID=2013562 RepID=A0A9X0UHH9_9PROT|nr:UPF0280 family protein [Siccirubricoccus deserti]MBC4016225.1 UPF0280 family protein [Siccirubricoccus deserti]GGC48191.1 thiamine biosynthesis protein ApbE [Siccirubricoccus deserti]